MGDYFVYILASATKTLYIGVTNDLGRRIFEHKNKINKGFTKKYFISNLVYYEAFESPIEAIDREKYLKNWRRKCPPVPDRTGKVELVEKHNPNWTDLSSDWYE